ncbi:MAG: S-layer homology domain-containing protein [Acidimicrobiia bacterium]|nr:S-layer homology domain-containing protein [Acidimicrobiia bacterium]
MTRQLTRLALALAIGLMVISADVASAAEPAPDAFSADSFWNTPVAPDATVHPNSDNIIDFLVADNDLDGCITLGGAADSSNWGMPTFVADSSDPETPVSTVKWDVPPEFAHLRIPIGATAADNSDGEMVVYDLVAGVVAQLSKAVYSSGTWTVSGGSVAYLDSNGLDGSLPQSDEPKNGGTFRGYPGSTAMVHYDDVAGGRLDNVVKIGVNTANARFVFPMIGSDGDTSNPDAPLQGMHIRIRPDVDLAGLGLTGQALTIARGLQEFGMIVADSTGGAVVLALEDTVAGGRGNLWKLNRESLCAITGAHLEVLADSGTPTSPSGFTDVAGHFFEPDITWLVEAGITKGCGSGRFCPDAPVSRGQMAAFLSRALNLETAPSAGFTDTVGHFFERDIDRLFAANVTRGCATGIFCPDRLMTRGEMAAFLVRGFGLPAAPPYPFTDTVGSYFSHDIDRLAASGITRGCTASTFCPNDHVTRGQMAAFLRRAKEG